jgi:geranylgeranyl diphosphate synthase type I
LLQSTITLPVIYYLEMVEDGSPEWLAIQSIVDRSRQDGAFVEQALDRIRDSGAVERAIERANDYVDQAKRRLDVVPDPETRELLGELADQTVRRVS